MGLIEKVSGAVCDYGMTENRGKTAVALSGGADSVSLLLAMKTLSESLGIELSACHLNHGLRGAESDLDEEFCKSLCGRLGIPFVSKKLNVKELAQKHESAEEAARRIRYGFFSEVLEDLGKSSVLATAHTLNDSAETVLLNLIRGTGLSGLCGIPPVRELGEFRVIRPLIRCTRADVEAFLAENGQNYVTDKTNFSEDYTRNRIRLNILPEILKINPSALDTVGRMTKNLREDNAFLEELTTKALESARSGKGFAAAEIARLPAPVRSRAVRRILSEGGIEPSALRINTAVSLLEKRSARYNPCKNRFFTIRKGVCFIEKIEQHYRKFNEAAGKKSK